MFMLWKHFVLLLSFIHKFIYIIFLQILEIYPQLIKFLVPTITAVDYFCTKEKIGWTFNKYIQEGMAEVLKQYQLYNYENITTRTAFYDNLLGIVCSCKNKDHLVLYGDEIVCESQFYVLNSGIYGILFQVLYRHIH